MPGHSRYHTGAKLVLIGGTIETARRVGQSAWSSFLSSFYLTAHFSEVSDEEQPWSSSIPTLTRLPQQEDYPFDWLNYWLEKQPAYRNSKEFETHTRTSTSGRGRGSATDELDEYNDDDDDDEVRHSLLTFDIPPLAAAST